MIALGLQRFLEFKEGRIGLEVGIGFCRGDEPAESRRELAFGGGALGAVSAVLRLVGGMVVKWVVVIGVLVIGAGLYKLPPLPLLAGVVAGLVAQMLVAVGKQR